MGIKFLTDLCPGTLVGTGPPFQRTQPSGLSQDPSETLVPQAAGIPPLCQGVGEGKY